jgi:hypothetical protein
MGQQQPSISISSSGTISLKRSYICGNYNSTHYYAQNNVTGNYELISADATQTISYAVSKLTSGRTWQETVLLKGTFSIGTTVTLSAGNVKLDFSQATVNLAASIVAFRANAGNITFYGGQYNPFTNTGTHSQWVGRSGSSAIQAWSDNCVVDGFEFSGFTDTLVGVLVAASGSSTMTMKNCYLHDNAGSGAINLVGSGGYHNIINCKISLGIMGIMGNPGVPNNKVIGCEFYGWNVSGGHAIYFDGGGSNSGYNEVSGCTFHDGVNGAGLHIKCQWNTIHNNTFTRLYKFTGSETVGISLYSEFSGYTANDNDIYNNTFNDCYFGIWIGHNTQGNNPTLRNKIHNNVFTSVTKCIRLLAASNTAEDTKIYYNDFHSCGNPFPNTGTSASLINNTVVAYNYFDASVPGADVSWIQSCVNSMSYQNTFFPSDTTLAMANFNYASVADSASYYYVAPRA